MTLRRRIAQVGVVLVLCPLFPPYLLMVGAEKLVHWFDTTECRFCEWLVAVSERIEQWSRKK